MPENNNNKITRIFSQMIRSLRNPNYRVYILGSFAQFASLTTQVVFGPLLIFRLTGSPGLLGLMALIGSVPMIVMSIYGGAIADRLPKKKIVILGLMGSAAVTCLIGLLLSFDIVSSEKHNSYLILMVAMLFMGALNGIVMPALQAMVPEIVEKEELMNAVALNSMGVNALNLFTPALVGFLIDEFDFDVIYYGMAAMYVCSVVLISFVKSSNKAYGAGGNIISEISKGFQYIKRDKVIFTVLLVTIAATLLSMPYQQLMPIFADDILKVGATGMGVLLSFSGIGAVVTSLVMTMLPNRKRGLILLISGLISGLGLVVFSFSAMMGLSMMAMVFVGLAQTFRVTVGSTLLQVYAEPEYRGRVMSIFHIQWGVASLFTFISGLLAEVVPVQWVLGTLSMTLIAFSVIMIAVLPRFRRLD